MRTTKTCAALVAVLSFLRPSEAFDPAPPRGVPKDPDAPARFESSPDGFVRLGDAVYFAADDGVHGRELWRTDGTADGTTLVADIGPGRLASIMKPARMTVAGKLLYFVTGDFKHPGYLWRTDGTAAGTIPLTDENRRPFPNLVRGLTAAGDTLFFSNADEELWKTDGTVAGTALLKDVRPGPPPAAIRNFTPAGRLLFFTAFDGKDRQLWRSDGTEAGTIRLLGLPVNEHELAALGEELFFVAKDEQGHRNVWRSDGTLEGTIRLTDFGLIPNGLGPMDLTAAGKTLYFTAFEAGVPTPRQDHLDDFDHELWKSDGTPAGTVRVADLAPGPRSSSPSDLVTWDGEVFFAANGGPRREIWKHDGTRFGTYRYGSLPAAFSVGVPARVAVAGKLVLFSARGGSSDHAWMTDGTAAGTVPLRDPAAGSIFSNPGHVTPAGDGFFFTTANGRGGTALGHTDGTIGGTERLPAGRLEPWAFKSADSFGSRGFERATAGNTLLFAASDAATGFELWKSDGTREGTVLVKDINTTPAQ